MITFIILCTIALIIAISIIILLATVGIISIGCIAVIIDPIICALLIVGIFKLISWIVRALSH